MKHAADELVTLLARAEQVLDTTERRLENEFSARYKGLGLNPLLLSKRIKRLQQQIPSLKSECQELIQRKQSLIDAARQTLLANCSQLEELSTRCAVPPAAPDTDDASVLADFTEALASWDKQAALQTKELADAPAYLSREELNHALAGSLLSRH